MDMILSWFKKKKSTVELLEELENVIQALEENKSSALIKQKKIRRLLYNYSVVICILCGAAFYFKYSDKFHEKFYILLPIAISPVLLYLVTKITSWHFGKQIKRNETRLVEMKKEKKRILDEVMNKETYKVAKEILDKYSNENVPQKNELRRRPMGTAMSPIAPRPQQQSPGQQNLNANAGGSPLRMGPQPQRPQPAAMHPPMRFPAPIISRERSYMDRVADFLIGDGPNNRFALICSHCHSHNGMALKEEFEYINFKCCYCFFFNPARKIRPEAPKLEKSHMSASEVENSNSDFDSDIDSESAEEQSVQSDLKTSVETSAKSNNSKQTENSQVPAEEPKSQEKVG